MKNKILKCMCATVNGKLGEVEYNAKQIIDTINEAIQQNVDVLAFPEMSLSGYSCGDVLFNQYLHENVQKALDEIATYTKGSKVFTVVGSPIKVGKRIYNCAVAIQDGSIVAIVPKTILDESGERESRWITVPESISETTIDIAGNSVVFSPAILFEDKKSDICIGITLGQDFDYPISTGGILAENGANTIINISTARETVNYFDYVKQMVRATSAQKKCAYLYVSSGRLESTSDGVFSNYMAICENGDCLAETQTVLSSENVIGAFVDMDRIQQVQLKSKTISKLFSSCKDEIAHVNIQLSPNSTEKCMSVDKEPFLEGLTFDVVCQRIIEIQSAALLQKIKYSGRDKLILGVSGGLDSTVALLVCCYAFQKAKLPLTNIIGVTMPGPGTTERTYRNSCDIMRVLGITAMTIDINNSVVAHLQNIKHQEGVFDITYEQTQSRERTKILMDLANQEKGIVIGTGDMSEFALGWMSYSGDQISMYGLNSGIPKTVIKHLAKYYTLNASGELKNILQGIIETPVSPELLPVESDGTQKQKTEDLVGPYIVHDFYLYYFAKYGYSPNKILYLAKNAFADDYTDLQLKKWMKTFITRFYTRQFKRTCFPDGCQVFDVSLSPRNGWIMPSDVYNEALLTSLEE